MEKRESPNQDLKVKELLVELQSFFEQLDPDDLTGCDLELRVNRE
jgi:hypothetical protein